MPRGMRHAQPRVVDDVVELRDERATVVETCAAWPMKNSVIARPSAIRTSVLRFT